VRFENQKVHYSTVANTLSCYNAGDVVVKLEVVGLGRGVNPTTLSYNASAVKIYNITNSIARL
jgi:hypothetical protein